MPTTATIRYAALVLHAYQALLRKRPRYYCAGPKQAARRCPPCGTGCVCPTHRPPDSQHRERPSVRLSYCSEYEAHSNSPQSTPRPFHSTATSCRVLRLMPMAVAPPPAPLPPPPRTAVAAAASASCQWLLLRRRPGRRPSSCRRPRGRQLLLVAPHVV